VHTPQPATTTKISQIKFTCKKIVQQQLQTPKTLEPQVVLISCKEIWKQTYWTLAGATQAWVLWTKQKMVETLQLDNYTVEGTVSKGETDIFRHPIKSPHPCSNPSLVRIKGEWTEAKIQQSTHNRGNDQTWRQVELAKIWELVRIFLQEQMQIKTGIMISSEMMAEK
jgi:hypothetical protein